MSAPLVAGIDPSLTSSGVVVLDESLSATPTLVRSKGKRDASWQERAGRCADLAKRIADACQGVQLAVVEGPAYGHSAKSGFFDRAMLLGLILEHLPCPYAVASPASIKKWMASTGSAPKALVAARVGRMLPDLQAVSFDVTDAAAMALMGAAHLGFLERSEARKRAEAAVDWGRVG